MTREEALKKAQIIDVQGGYAVDIVYKIYRDLEAYLDEAMQKAKTWDAHVALQEVKDYLEGKDDTTKH